MMKGKCKHFTAFICFHIMVKRQWNIIRILEVKTPGNISWLTGFDDIFEYLHFPDCFYGGLFFQDV